MARRLREAVCTACGSTFAVAPEDGDRGTDACSCPECHALLALDYAAPDPIPATATEEAPF